jgi:OHCU decarboxylase
MSFHVAAPPPGEDVVHPVDEVLPPAKLGIYGAQHVLAFYAGAVIVPILLAGAIGLRGDDLVYLISADLFTCGIASIIQAIGFWKVGVRLPLLQGVTFTAVAPMISIGQSEGGGVDGLLHIYGAVIVAGVVTFLMAPHYSRLLRLFPPVVTGTVITVIGVALLPVAAQQAGGGDPTAKEFGSFQNLELAGVTLLSIVVVQRLWRGKFVATIAVLLGLVFGTLVATVFGITDFGAVSDAKAVGVTTPFHFGLPTFGVAAIVSMLIVMFITAVGTTGDVFATGEIVEKPIRRTDIARAIRADGLATTLGGILNSFPYTCFAENVGLVRLTRVKSRFVVATAGAIMIVLGLSPKVDAVEPTRPRPDLLTLDEVNRLSDREFVERFGPLFQGPPWIAAEVAGMRPFDSLYAMRHALHSTLFDAPAERRRTLIDSYPDIAAKVALGQGSRRDQASAGLDRLTPEEYERFDALNEIYHEKLGSPFVICVRENTKETILEEFERRVHNTPAQEQMAALVEIAKIANLRLFDLVEDDIPDPPKEEPPWRPALGDPPRFETVAGDDSGVAPAGA